MIEDTQQKLDNAMAELDRVLRELDKTRRALHAIVIIRQAWCANWQTCTHRDCNAGRRAGQLALDALPNAGVWRTGVAS